MPFVVHSLGDRMYGFWTLIGTLIGYYGLLDLGLATAVNRHIAGGIGAGDEDECNRIVNTALPLYFLMGLAALIVSIIIAVSAGRFISNPQDVRLFTMVILILGVNIAIEFPLKVFRGILVSQIRFDIMSFLQMLTLALRTTLIVAVLIMGHGLLALALVTVIAGIPAKILTIYFAKKNLPFIRLKLKGWNGPTARRLFSYSYITFIVQIANNLRLHFDSVVISAFMGLVAVTHYRIAGLIMMHFRIFISSSIGVIQPAFSRLYAAGDHEGVRRALFLSSKISICITSFIGFGLILWGKPFIERWMGSEYLDAYPVLVILTLCFVFDLWQAPSVSLLFGTSKHKVFAYLNTIEGLFNLLLSILLIKPYGLIGVALGTFIPMTIIKLLIQPVFFCRLTSIPYGEYMYRMSRTIAVVCLALVIPTLISIRFAAPSFLALFLLASVSIILYTPVVWFFIFDSSEISTIRGALSSRGIKKKGLSVQ